MKLMILNTFSYEVLALWVLCTRQRIRPAKISYQTVAASIELNLGILLQP